MQLPVPHVLRELEWITSGDYAYKTILVTTETSIVASTLEGVGFCGVATDVEPCLRLLSRLTTSRATIPARREPDSASPRRRSDASSKMPMILGEPGQGTRISFDTSCSASELHP